MLIYKKVLYKNTNQTNDPNYIQIQFQNDNIIVIVNYYHYATQCYMYYYRYFKVLKTLGLFNITEAYH